MRATSLLVAGFAGILFAAGLVLGQMTQPARVIAFLDVTGSWDPTLLFVMGGAVGVHLPLLVWLRRRRQPWLAPSARLPRSSNVDAPLLIGATLFGVGWGLSGYCPGPALVASVTARANVLLLVGSMFVGMAVCDLVRSMRRATPAPAPDPSAP